MTHDGTGSVWGGTWLYLVILDQYRAVLVGTWWYWVITGCCVSTGRYWLVLDRTGSVEGGTDWYLVVLSQYGALLVDS